MYAGGGPKWVILLVLLSLGCQGAQVASDVYIFFIIFDLFFYLASIFLLFNIYFISPG
jgi:hypothetical protein